jgi:hypothetical protein
MTRYKVFCLCLAVAASISLAAAQEPQVRSSSGKAGADPLKNVTKPLTPKSAMPPQRKSSSAAPKATSGGKPDAELTRLERQPIRAEIPKSGNAGPAKSAPLVKSADTSAGSGSGINFKYQKPAPGMQASTPGANSRSSSTPRVKKN